MNSREQHREVREPKRRATPSPEADATSLPNLSMVVTMNEWMLKYHNHPDFLAYFLHEQDYVDAMFRMIVMFNFGVRIEVEDLLVTEL